MSDTVLATNPTRRQAAWELLKLAFPLILSNLFWTLQMTIDRILLSQYSSEAVAACMGSLMVFAVPFLLLQITAAFATTFVAQYVGAGRPERIGPVINQTLYFSAFAGVAFLFLIPFAEPVFAAIGHDGQIPALEVAYFQPLCFCAFPMFVVAAVTAFFAGRGDSWTVLWYYAAGMVANAVLGYLWIFGHGGFPEWGIIGSGWATVVASYISAGIALALMWRPALRREFQLWTSWRLDWKLLGRLLRFGLPSGMQAAMDCSIWTGFTLMIGWLGPVEQASSSIVLAINGTFLIPMIGVGQAISVVVGQRLGENRPDLAERSAWLGALMATAFMTGVAILLATAPGLFLFLFASGDAQWEAVAEAIPVLLYFVAAYSFFDSMNIMITFALRGAGDTRFVTWLTFGLGFVLLVVPMYYLMNVIVLPHYAKGERIWAMYWVWGIATAYLMVQCSAFTARFIWGPWRSMRVIEPKVGETIADVTPVAVADMPAQPSYSEGWKEETPSVPPL